jgi:hypothetical protein
MSANLTPYEKNQYCKHKEAVEKDGKLPYKEALKWCQEQFSGKTPSNSQLSRAWQDKEKWVNAKNARSKAKRIRQAAWPDLEKALALWVTQVRSKLSTSYCGKFLLSS